MCDVLRHDMNFFGHHESYQNFLHEYFLLTSIRLEFLVHAFVEYCNESTSSGFFM